MATVTESNTQLFSVSGTPTVTVDCTSGDVHVSAGDAGGVTVTYTKKMSAGNEDAARALLEHIEVELTQRGDDIDVRTRFHRPFGLGNLFGGFNNVQIDITVLVPPATNLRLALNSGDAEVSGIEGEMDLHLHSGDVMARDLRLTGQSDMHLNSGKATFEHVAVTAPIHFKMNSGNMALRDVSFSTRMTLTANSGDVRGDITLSEGADLRLTLNSGDVRLSLPAETASHLEASAIAGNVRVSGFPVTTTRSYASSRVSGDFAPNPTSAITCHINSGNLSIAAQ